MGATLFYTYAGNTSVLPINIGATPVRVQSLQGLENAGNVTIITDSQINMRDTNQFFMSFDDKIHHYHFGKGLGTISVQGLILPNCKGELAGVKALFQKIGKMRGKTETISVGSHTFTGVLVDSTVTFSGEPMTNAVFQINFAMIDHSIQANAAPKTAC